MKRSAALASLSRDHHQALVVAQRLRRAGPDSADEARTRFLAYWTEHGLEHFRREEEILLPGYAAHGDARHPLIQRVLDDHAAIRRRAARLAQDAAGDLDALHDLGAQLAAHVRLEERELFPLIENAIPVDELTALAGALELAGADRSRGGHGAAGRHRR